MQLTFSVLCSAALVVSVAQASELRAEETNDPLLFPYENGTVKLSIDGAVAGFYSNNTYWDLAGAVLPGSDTRYTWAEGALEVGVRLDHRFDDANTFYAGASGIGTFTADEDIFGTIDVTYLTYDDLYAGLRHGKPGDDFYFDISGGSQPYAAGLGMLIGDGAPEGSARGAVVYAPFGAWSMAAIGRLGLGNLLIEGFYLDADEIYEPDTNTTLAGGNLRYTLGPDQFVGVYGGAVLESDAPSFQALPGFAGSVTIPNGRDGLAFVTAYAKLNPLPDDLSGLFLLGDFTYERNDRIDLEAWGLRTAIGYKFENAPLSPTLSYSFQTFSGDDANTSGIERFDPILGGASPVYFGIGANSGLLLSASNLTVHRIGLQTVLSPQDFLNFSYYHLRVNELNSPLAFEQDPSLVGLGALPPPIAISSYEFANEFSIDYTHAVNSNIFFNTSINYSIPGKGLQDLFGGRLENWFAANAVLTIKY